MRNYLDAQAMAKVLQTALHGLDRSITEGQARAITAAQFGYGDWADLAAKIDADRGGGPHLNPAIPIFRMFDVDKAKAFYVDYLGFAWDWAHRLDERAPVYAQVSRSGFRLHLSEHHGDATPGSSAFVPMSGIVAYRDELAAKTYPFMDPDVEDMPWGRILEVIDPFGNHIRFCEPAD